jgi:hypothetical protein
VEHQGLSLLGCLIRARPRDTHTVIRSNVGEFDVAELLRTRRHNVAQGDTKRPIASIGPDVTTPNRLDKL